MDSKEAQKVLKGLKFSPKESFRRRPLKEQLEIRAALLVLDRAKLIQKPAEEAEGEPENG